MQQTEVEKRKFPRLDTSGSDDWIVRVYGVRGKPVEGTILNLSLGGLAFEGKWKRVARTITRDSSKIEILLPNKKVVEADSTLLRVRPKVQNDNCVCVMLFSDLNRSTARQLQNFIPS